MYQELKIMYASQSSKGEIKEKEKQNINYAYTRKRKEMEERKTSELQLEKKFNPNCSIKNDCVLLL